MKFPARIRLANPQGCCFGGGGCTETRALTTGRLPAVAVMAAESASCVVTAVTTRCDLSARFGAVGHQVDSVTAIPRHTFRLKVVVLLPLFSTW